MSSGTDDSPETDSEGEIRPDCQLRWRSHLTVAGQPVYALRVRHVDGPGTPGLPVRTLRGRRGRPLHYRGAGPRTAGCHRRPAPAVGFGAAPCEDEGCVLQGREPARAVGAHQFRLPRLYLPGPPGWWTERVLREVSSGHQQPGEEGEGPADQGLAPQPPHGHGPVRHRAGHQSPGARLDQRLRGLLSLRVVLLDAAHRRASRSMGHAQIQAISTQAGSGVSGVGRRETPAAHAVRSLAAGLCHRAAVNIARGWPAKRPLPGAS